MRVSGVVALTLIFLIAPASAKITKRKIRSRPARQVVATIKSPDGQKKVQVMIRGKVRLNGRPVRSGRGKVVGAPVWRRDSKSLAFLQRSPYGIKLVVLTSLDAKQPLIWHLPPLANSMKKVFWISRRRIGIGSKDLTPRVVVNWSTSSQVNF